MHEALGRVLTALDGRPFNLSANVPGYPLGGPTADDELFSDPVLDSLWERAVQEVDDHGYASARRRLEDLQEDVRGLTDQFDELESRHYFYSIFERVCKRRLEVHGPDTKVVDTIDGGAEGQSPDGSFVTWEITRKPARSDETRELTSARFRLTDEALERFEMRRSDGLLNFSFHSWKQAYQLASNLTRLAIDEMESVGRALQFATLHADIMESALRRDRLAGYTGRREIQDTPERGGDLSQLTKDERYDLDLWAIAVTFQEYLDSLNGCPTTEEDAKEVFPTIIAFQRWVGERSYRYNTGDARSTGHRVLDRGEIRVKRKEGQRFGLLEEVQALYQLGKEMRAQLE